MSNNAKIIVGLILVIIGLCLAGNIFYVIYDSFVNGNLFNYDLSVEFFKFIGCIITFAIGGSLVSQYKI